MTRVRRTIAAAAALAACAVAAPLPAQTTGCGIVGPPAGCFAVEQALQAAVPQVGIAIVGGNPLPGTASVGGVRLGFFPRVTASLRVGAARMRLPDVRQDFAAPSDRARTELVPAASLGAAVALFEGFTRGRAAGIGAVDVLLDGSVLPGSGGLEKTRFGWGAGLRVGLLRETFGTPAVNVSAMLHRVEGIRYGSACTSLPCTSGSLGQLDFDVHDVSTRVTIAKRVARVGLLGGLGYDRFKDGDAQVSFASPTFVSTVAREVDEGRWSIFGNLSLPMTVGAVTLEGGWMSGGERAPGYAEGSAFDPGAGTLFGSLALRLSL